MGIFIFFVILVVVCADNLEVRLDHQTKDGIVYKIRSEGGRPEQDLESDEERKACAAKCHKTPNCAQIPILARECRWCYDYQCAAIKSTCYCMTTFTVLSLYSNMYMSCRVYRQEKMY